SGIRAGLKQRGRDVALIAADRPASVAGVFTTNRDPAAPVQLARRRVAAGRASAVLVHAGNANACTGAEGLRTALDATALAARLGEAVDATLNAITVDGDMSTNDTVLLLASGAAANAPIAAGSRQHAVFTRAVTEVLDDIARLVVLDGEGGTRMVEVRVHGARSGGDARRVARAVAESTLCNAAFHGGDPNWGRFVCAAGTAGAALDPDRG